MVPLYCPADSPDGSAVTVTVFAGVVPDGGLTDNQPDDEADSVYEAAPPSDVSSDTTCDCAVLDPSSAVKPSEERLRTNAGAAGAWRLSTSP